MHSAGKGQGSRVFFQIRVTVLLAILAAVLIWGYRDIARRKARTTWQRRLDVAIVLVAREALDAGAEQRLRAEIPALEDRLAAEFARWRATTFRPFKFDFYGPVQASGAPPATPGDGVLELARYTFELWRYLRDIDDAAGLRASSVDSAIYVVARRPKSQSRTFVEGTSQEGGKVGLVEVELDDTISDFALFVAAHELMHTLGASDKYDEGGHTLVPSGLPEPDKTPLYPQRYAEVMARNVALGASEERPPRSLDELAVGAATAAEIGWR